MWVGTHIARGASAFLSANQGFEGEAIRNQDSKLVTQYTQQLNHIAAGQKFLVLGTPKNRKNIFSKFSEKFSVVGTRKNRKNIF